MSYEGRVYTTIKIKRLRISAMGPLQAEMDGSCLFEFSSTELCLLV